MNFMQNVIDTLNSQADTIAKLVTRRTELENDIKSGRFTASAIGNELQPELSNVRSAIAEAKDETRRAVAQLVAQHVTELERDDAMDGGKLDEADMKLLNSGVPLTKKDLLFMLERHQATGNRTMQIAVTRWAREHEINLGVFVGHEQEIAAVKELPGVVGRYVDHWIDTPEAKTMIDKMFVDTAGA